MSEEFIEVQHTVLATELAHSRMQEEMINDNAGFEEQDDVLYFTENAQLSFNKWYDYYYDIITECKKEEEVDVQN